MARAEQRPSLYRILLPMLAAAAFGLASDTEAQTADSDSDFHGREKPLSTQLPTPVPEQGSQVTYGDDGQSEPQIGTRVAEAGGGGNVEQEEEPDQPGPAVSFLVTRDVVVLEQPSEDSGEVRVIAANEWNPAIEAGTSVEDENGDTWLKLAENEYVLVADGVERLGPGSYEIQSRDVPPEEFESLEPGAAVMVQLLNPLNVRDNPSLSGRQMGVARDGRLYPATVVGTQDGYAWAQIDQILLQGSAGSRGERVGGFVALVPGSVEVTEKDVVEVEPSIRDEESSTTIKPYEVQPSPDTIAPLTAESLENPDQLPQVEVAEASVQDILNQLAEILDIPGLNTISETHHVVATQQTEFFYNHGVFLPPVSFYVTDAMPYDIALKEIPDATHRIDLGSGTTGRGSSLTSLQLFAQTYFYFANPDEVDPDGFTNHLRQLAEYNFDGENFTLDPIRGINPETLEPAFLRPVLNATPVSIVFAGILSDENKQKLIDQAPGFRSSRFGVYGYTVDKNGGFVMVAFLDEEALSESLEMRTRDIPEEYAHLGPGYNLFELSISGLTDLIPGSLLNNGNEQVQVWKRLGLPVHNGDPFKTTQPYVTHPGQTEGNFWSSNTFPFYAELSEDLDRVLEDSGIQR